MDFKLIRNDKPIPGAPEFPKELPLDAKAIPDLDKLLKEVLEMLYYINTDEMQKLEETDNYSFERHLDSKFESLSLEYNSIFRLLLDKENREKNILKLIEVFSKLQEVKAGLIDISKADIDFKEELNEEYIYPKFGGKEQFEKTISEKNKKTNINKKRKKQRN